MVKFPLYLPPVAYFTDWLPKISIKAMCTDVTLHFERYCSKVAEEDTT